MKLENKVALIFGGSSGIGRASAEACADEGASVMIADVDRNGGSQAVADIKAAGRAASFLHVDITDEEEVEAAVHSTVAEFGKSNILVTSVGAESRGTESPWHFAIELFLKGPFYACKQLFS